MRGVGSGDFRWDVFGWHRHPNYTDGGQEHDLVLGLGERVEPQGSRNVGHA